MAKIEPANLLLKDKNGNTGLVKSLTNKDITTLKNVVTNVNYIKDFVNANGGSLPVQGDLKLTATDAAGKNGKILLGTSSGTLQWNGKNIVRSVNGTNADENGNIAITSVANATKASQDKNGAQIDTTYFKSANGIFTGREYYRDVDNDLLRFNGGNTHDGGACLMLFGENMDDGRNSQGAFDLVACSKESSKQLIGKPDGTLTWGGKTIAPVTGKIEWFAFNTPPDGYLVCNGASVSRTTYADLFAVIGTKFGSGNGSTTFTLPNLIDKFAQGSTTVGVSVEAGLPNITGTISYMPHVETSGINDAQPEFGAFRATRIQETFYAAPPFEATRWCDPTFDASRSNSIYGNSSTVQPPALTLLPCIKY